MPVLETIGTILSIVGGAAGGIELYKSSSTLIKGDPNEILLKQILEELKRQGDAAPERLSDHILYSPGFAGVTDSNRTKQIKNTDLREVREMLDPLQRALDEDILSSAQILTPEKLQNVMGKNPWDVLHDVAPLAHPVKPSNPNFMPVIFEYSGMRFVGWQMRGMLTAVFDCEFHDFPGISTDRKRSAAEERKENSNKILAGKDLAVPVSSKNAPNGSIYVSTTTETFTSDVLDASRQATVLVVFWAPWCGPCKQLTPALEKAVVEGNSRVKLVKLNVDDNSAIVTQLGIQSIPAVVAFKDSRPIDGFMGAISDSSIRTFIDKVQQ